MPSNISGSERNRKEKEPFDGMAMLWLRWAVMGARSEVEDFLSRLHGESRKLLPNVEALDEYVAKQVGFSKHQAEAIFRFC
jgi:hypothetical protein